MQVATGLKITKVGCHHVAVQLKLFLRREFLAVASLQLDDISNLLSFRTIKPIPKRLNRARLLLSFLSEVCIHFFDNNPKISDAAFDLQLLHISVQLQDVDDLLFVLLQVVA